MPCLICRYFQPCEPPQHKADREAGKCQPYCGSEWNQVTAINYVKHHGKLGGWCHLHPEAKQVPHAYICGDISVRDNFYEPGWGIVPITPEDNLFEWASKQLGTLVHGTWTRRENERLEAENEQLRSQLKRVREISASRLKRLQKSKPEQPKAEPERKPEPMIGEPIYPRLVAAE